LSLKEDPLMFSSIEYDISFYPSQQASLSTIVFYKIMSKTF